MTVKKVKKDCTVNDLTHHSALTTHHSRFRVLLHAAAGKVANDGANCRT